ncbi:MAG: hypothetical protein ACR2G7_14155 [Acidimicrobiales bacterium]
MVVIYLFTRYPSTRDDHRALPGFEGVKRCAHTSMGDHDIRLFQRNRKLSRREPWDGANRQVGGIGESRLPENFHAVGQDL